MHNINSEHIVRLYGVVLDTNALMLVSFLDCYHLSLLGHKHFSWSPKALSIMLIEGHTCKLCSLKSLCIIYVFYSGYSYSICEVLSCILDVIFTTISFISLCFTGRIFAFNFVLHIYCVIGTHIHISCIMLKEFTYLLPVYVQIGFAYNTDWNVFCIDVWVCFSVVYLV